MKHCIVVKFVPEVDEKVKADFIPQIKQLFENTKEIDGIYDVQVLTNCIHIANRADIMIVIDMEKTALPDYDQCQWHQLWKHEYGRFIQSKLVFDYE
ncbi:MAG: Dabb family protein [Treponema sp.]|nr:Dabb family protein [Treponema sp.]